MNGVEVLSFQAHGRMKRVPLIEQNVFRSVCVLLHDINRALSAKGHVPCQWNSYILYNIDCGIGTNDCIQSEWHLLKLKQFETVVQHGA